MTTTDIEALEEIYAQWAQGNFWSFESFDDAVHARWATEVVDMGSSVGVDGLQQLLQEWLKAWESCRIEAEEYHDAGEQIVVFVRVHAQGSGSAINVDMENAHVWTMRDGRALSIRAYSDRQRALREAGLA
jgi:ketosteroid isomerase-like protein